MNNSKRPVFSVVVPMYNVEDYIECCLDSLLNQSYKDFEIICVDDGCTDKTLAKLNRYQDGRIRLVQQSNSGLAAARNTGIRYSRGIYIAFLDSDDFWHQDKLKLHHEHFLQNPKLGLSYSASLFVDELDQALGIGQHPKLNNISAADVFCRNPVGNGSAAVLRRAALNQIAFFNPNSSKPNQLQYFDEDLRQSEDVDCWLRLALQTQWEVQGLKQALTFYRVNQQGLSGNVSKQLASWESAVAKLKQKHTKFFNRYYPLARAYQLRYLARRAVMNQESLKATVLFIRAVACNSKIIIQEPLRTLVTLAGVVASYLPGVVFEKVKSLAFSNMKSSGA